jgi:hypothetical protein
MNSLLADSLRAMCPFESRLATVDFRGTELLVFVALGTLVLDFVDEVFDEDFVECLDDELDE